MRRNAPETDDHTRVQGRSWYALDTKRYDRRVAVVVAVVVVVVVVQRFSKCSRPPFGGLFVKIFPVAFSSFSSFDDGVFDDECEWSWYQCEQGRGRRREEGGGTRLFGQGWHIIISPFRALGPSLVLALQWHTPSHSGIDLMYASILQGLY